MYTHTYIHKHNNTNNAQHLTPCSCGLPPFPRRSTRSRRGRTASTHAMGTILCYIYVYIYIYIYMFVLCINICVYICITLYVICLLIDRDRTAATHAMGTILCVFVYLGVPRNCLYDQR